VSAGPTVSVDCRVHAAAAANRPGGVLVINTSGACRVVPGAFGNRARVRCAVLIAR